MPRPKRPRCIASKPAIKGFKPRGAVETGEVILSLEEFEALRLIDYEGMDQSGAAQVMDVSRQTVGRVLKAARYKIAESLVTAKRLTVQGGCYEMRGLGKGKRWRHGAENTKDVKGGDTMNKKPNNAGGRCNGRDGKGSFAGQGRCQGGPGRCRTGTGQGRGQGKKGQGRPDN